MIDISCVLFLCLSPFLFLSSLSLSLFFSRLFQPVLIDAAVTVTARTSRFARILVVIGSDRKTTNAVVFRVVTHRVVRRLNLINAETPANYNRHFN